MTDKQSPDDRGDFLPLSTNGWTVLGIVSFSNGLSGYQVKKWSDFGPGFFYISPSFSQIYSELKKLEEMGLVTSREADSEENARNKRLYWITADGKQALADWCRNSPVDRPVLKHPMLSGVKRPVCEASRPVRAATTVHGSGFFSSATRTGSARSTRPRRPSHDAAAIRTTGDGSFRPGSIASRSPRQPSHSTAQ